MAEFRSSTESSVFGTEEALAKILMELINPEGEKALTSSDVTPQEVFGLATLTSYAEVFKSKLIEKWIRNFLLLRISRNRLGRREFELITAGIRESADSKVKGKKFGDLFSGLK